MDGTTAPDTTGEPGAETRDYTDPSSLLDLDPAERTAGKAWAAKEAGVRVDHDHDIAPVLDAYRGGALVASGYAGRVDRDHGLALARGLAVPFDADEVVLAVDTHVGGPTDPRTGTRWEPGAMQRFCDGEDGCATGVITDCVMTLAVRRDGSARIVQRTYHVDHGAGKVHWVAVDRLDDSEEGNRLDGLVVDGLRGAWADADEWTASTAAFPDEHRDWLTTVARVLSAQSVVLGVPGAATSMACTVGTAGKIHAFLSTMSAEVAHTVMERAVLIRLGLGGTPEGWAAGVDLMFGAPDDDPASEGTMTFSPIRDEDVAGLVTAGVDTYDPTGEGL